MTKPDDDEQPDIAPRDPRARGSVEALTILPLLNAAPRGLTSVELQARTGWAWVPISRALQGLKDRGLIVPAGHTKGTVWRCKHHVQAANAGQPERNP